MQSPNVPPGLPTVKGPTVPVGGPPLVPIPKGLPSMRIAPKQPIGLPPIGKLPLSAAIPIPGVLPGGVPKGPSLAGPSCALPPRIGGTPAPTVAGGPEGPPVAPSFGRNREVTPREKQERLAKAQRMEEDHHLQNLIVDGSAIRLFGSREINAYAVTTIHNTNFEGIGSVNDSQLGVTEDNKLCTTCHQDNMQCPGHLGMIKLVSPMYHPNYMRTIIRVLTCVCNSCGGLLLTPKEIRDKGYCRYRGEKRLELLEEECSKITICRRDDTHEPCPANDGSTPTKECTANPKYLPSKLKDQDTKRIWYRDTAQRGGGSENILTVEQAEKILNCISDADAELLGFENGSHPKDMILREIPVIPPVARQPTIRDGVVYRNQITELYIEIIKNNNYLLNNPNIPPPARQDIQKCIFFHYEHLIDNTDGRYAPRKDKEFSSIKQLIQGKDALIRGLLMGKRVNYSGRTVAGPAPQLEFGDIAIPRTMAPILTKPETVLRFNREKLQQALEEGRVTHIAPGEGDLKGRRLLVNERHRREYHLKIGDKVDRHLADGDIVLINRQPTLHKQSMMGYRVKLWDNLTIGLHLSYTTPLNADFDGDEVNVHDIQALDAQAEAVYLANVIDNIMNAQTNRPIMAAVYDVLSGTYVLTNETLSIPADEIDRYLDKITSRDQFSTLDLRLNKFNIPITSGRGLFSALLPPDFTYTKGEVYIREGVLLKGRITKKHIGNSHGSIVQILWKEYGRDRTVRFLTDLPFVVNKWLTEYGLSVGLKDCLPPAEQRVEHRKLIEQKINEARLYVRGAGAPPEDQLQYERYEANIKSFIGDVKNLGMSLLDKVMPPDNRLRIMIESEAKGTPFNAAQIAGLIGQQSLKGERLKKGMTEEYIDRDFDITDLSRRALPLSRYTRTLPYYDVDDLAIEAYGFIENSFISGMTPPNLFFHQAAGREGLMDTAIKTSETGAMHHRIVKALESIQVAYDGSVRNAVGTIFQFAYGEDGFDAAELQNVRMNTGEVPSFVDLAGSILRINSRYGYSDFPKV